MKTSPTQVPESQSPAVKKSVMTSPAANTMTNNLAASIEGLESKTLLTPEDLYLFNEGRHFRSYMRMGAHVAAPALAKAQEPSVANSSSATRAEDGVWFSVWAPNADRVAVIGDFNDWNHEHDLLQPLENSGVWGGFVNGALNGQAYKFRITAPGGYTVEKADPYAFYSEVPPKTASRIWQSQYVWNDQEWLRQRSTRQSDQKPMSIYEIHLGSWRRKPEEGNRSLTYRELADELPGYIKQMGFTHVELMPVMEHPFYGSWGYQTTGYFSPSSRFGTPDDFKLLIDRLHAEGIGVILDWVPSHFPSDEFALSYFNGTHLFEHEDPRLGYHPDWKSLIFNYGRNEVRSFLISSAMFWLDHFHIDGLRVDAVASMLYLDYSRKAGEWLPNKFGGRENLESIEFLKQMNDAISQGFPDVCTIAEESTAWPGVSKPSKEGGLGFGMKWDMGWMHDTLEYFKMDPLYRSYHQNLLTFRSVYAFTEKFVLSISHDEVVYGKGSMLGKMAGDDWQKFANLRALYAYMYAQPGKKLLFMGSEFAQVQEWGHERSLDWHLLDEGQNPGHRGVRDLLIDLNRTMSEEPALHENDFEPSGFEWLDSADSMNSVLSFFRLSTKGERILCIFNLTPNVRENYRIGVPTAGHWREILNTDSEVYGGSGRGNLGGVDAVKEAAHGREFSVTLTLPPLSALYFKNEVQREN